MTGVADHEALTVVGRHGRLPRNDSDHAFGRRLRDTLRAAAAPEIGDGRRPRDLSVA
jgi:hypothetical protein